MTSALKSNTSGNETAHYEKFVAKHSKSSTEWRKYSVPMLENACEERGLVFAQGGSPVMVKLLVEDESDDLRSRLEHKNFDVKADPTGFIRKEEIRAVRHVLDKLRKEIRIVTEVYIEGRRAVLKTNCATACAEADSKCANKSAKTPDQAARFEQVRIQARAYATTKRDNDLRINDRRIPALEKLLNRMRKHDDEWVARENAKVDRAVEGKEKAARARAEVQSKGAQLTKNKSKKDARIQEAGGTGSQNLPTASSPSAKATKKRVGTEATLNAVDQPKQTPEI